MEGARRRRSHPNIAYEHGDIRHMRFDNNEFDAAVSTLALDVIPEIEQVVAEMKRVTRPGGVVASAVTQFFGGMPAFDLVINTGAVLETDFAKLRSMRAGRQLFWPDGQAALWRKIGLVDVTEVPVVERPLPPPRPGKRPVRSASTRASECVGSICQRTIAKPRPYLRSGSAAPNSQGPSIPSGRLSKRADLLRCVVGDGCPGGRDRGDAVG